MRLGGVQKTSLIDYPGKISCVLFTAGCNFFCPYCHNPQLVRGLGPDKDDLDVLRVYHFLEMRKGQLDAVVISGGEPTLQNDLPEICRIIKSMGYPIKLDTNGSRPEMLHALISAGLVDYIAMDIKTDPSRYFRYVCDEDLSGKIIESIHLIMNAPVESEFRTTCVMPIVDADSMFGIAGFISGASLYALQRFEKSGSLLKPDFFEAGGRSASTAEILAFKAIVEPRVENCIIR